jgi:23S rRNA pseudouridine2605 synthase
MFEKIQKTLANAGVGSRRQIEGWIREGRITINGMLAKIGDRIKPSDKIRIEGREINLIKSSEKKTRVIVYYKPEGEICTRNDPEGRPTVFDRLPLLRNGRWVSIGRLDFNTSGLLILTNDGDLANKMMHPSAELEREYAVRIQGEVTPDMLKKLKKGVKLEDGVAHFEQITDVGGESTNHWYHVIVKQGRNRIVRRLFESQDVTVSRLIRVRFGSVHLPRFLKRGKWIELEKNEIMNLTEPQETSPKKPSLQRKPTLPIRQKKTSGRRH